MAVDREDADAPDATARPAKAIDGRDAHNSDGHPTRGITAQHEPQRTAPPQDPPVPTTSTRDTRMAEYVRYQLIVEAAYQAADGRSAWTESATVLREEWQAHKRRYPDREHQPPETPPDGGWHGGGNRCLSPEQNAEAAKCVADLRDEAFQSIRPAMERVAAADSGRRLAGLQHMLKGEDRLKEKIAAELSGKPETTVRAALGEVADGVRFTLEYPTEGYADGVLADVERLKAEGFQLIKLKNLWHAEHYKGVNSQWRAPGTGTRCEMQFHTAESLEVKELTHQAYERLRSAASLPAVERDFAEEQALEDFQSRANALLVTPPGVTAIEDFPKKEKNNG